MSQNRTQPTSTLTDTKQRNITSSLDGVNNRIHVEDNPVVEALDRVCDRLDIVIELLSQIA